MSFRSPTMVRNEFRAHPRRALVITTVVSESRAVKAHLTGPEMLIGEKAAIYEYGRFADPAGEWLVVHAITPQGNSDAGLVASKAHQEFGSFHAQIFVGVAGSLKDDIPIGSVVIGDYVYNGHSAKVEDAQTVSRPHGLPPARELLTAAQALIYTDEWRDLIRAPHGMAELPKSSDYPCAFPPLATIKGVVSGEEVVAGGKSARYVWLRSHFNDCGAVEMEGWGVMNAARYENTSAIVVRGISDMCAGKDHGSDQLHQPIAAVHAAAFAFSILSFRSKAPPPDGPENGGGVGIPTVVAETPVPPPDERRVDFVVNFEGSKDDWSDEKVNAVVDRLRRAVDDEKLKLVRIDEGSVRLVLSVRETSLSRIDFSKLREAVADTGVSLLGALPLESIRDAELAKKSLAIASADLLSWEKTLPGGKWIERPEREAIEARFRLESSSTALLGEPGSGKSALLSRMAGDLLQQGSTIFALKADFLSIKVRTETDLQDELGLTALPSELILRLAALQPVYVFIDQLDALASQLDLQSGRLNVLLNLVRRVGGMPNVHILLSARTFEFNHDVRLRSVNAEAITLALPPWHEVKERLADVGIESDGWPENAKDVVRIPQALKTYIALVGAGRTEPFTTYQAMLERLWQDRVASADDGEKLIALAADLAGQMAEEEALWLAASRFDDRLSLLKRLESLGLVVRSENNLSVAFSHQTIFEYVLARTFVRNTGLLSTYVLERQDSLFVRAKVWSALNYLRGAEVNSYERELLAIWKAKDLRRHIRLLLIEFLGQAREPLEFEKSCMAEVLSSPDLRLLGLKAIDGPGWFKSLASTAISDAMVGTELEVNQALRILALNWKSDRERVASLIKARWLPSAAKDSYSWLAVRECQDWSDEVEQIARSVIGRTPISIWLIDHTAESLGVAQLDVAIRVVREKLDYLLAEARRKPPGPAFPTSGTIEEKTAWPLEHRGSKEFEELLEATEWNSLPALAEAGAAAFLRGLWPWYNDVFSEIVTRSGRDETEYLYAGRYVLEFDRMANEGRSAARERPVMSAIKIAVEEFATSKPQEFLKWVDENSGREILVVQQLIAQGFTAAGSELASSSLRWLISDYRRFQLGSMRSGQTSTTVDLIRACAPHWKEEEIYEVEKEVREYRPNMPKRLVQPEQRKAFADMLRVTKRDLLRAVGVERLSSENQELVSTEQRALGERPPFSMEGGWIGSPMDAAAMSKAKDRDILQIFREIPDDTNWDHPRHWMRGGNIQLSRAFAEFAKSSPERAIRVMEQFEPRKQERAAGYALDAMADSASNDRLITDAILDLQARGFQSDEFRDSAARAVEKMADRKSIVGEAIVDVLKGWLSLAPKDGAEQAEQRSSFEDEDKDTGEGSVLWSGGLSSVLPQGNYNVLSALGSILLGRKDEGRDRYLAILDEHLSREQDPKVWKALLYRLSNAGSSSPKIVSDFLRKLFARYPEILATREAIIFLAYAQRWDDRLVFDLISGWRDSDRAFRQSAYGELVGLVAGVKGDLPWVQARREIISSGAEGAQIGLAHAAVNMWPDDKLRAQASDIMTELLKGGSRAVASAVLDIFRIVDELSADAPTVALLQALADPGVDLSGAPSSFIVERLQSLLPHEADLVAIIANKLIAGWRAELGNIQTATAMAAPQLTDLALTLHRLGGKSRQAGVQLFETMIEIDAYGARDVLAEIDGRFGSRQPSTRRRLPRRRKTQARRQAG